MGSTWVLSAPDWPHEPCYQCGYGEAPWARYNPSHDKPVPRLICNSAWIIICLFNLESFLFDLGYGVTLTLDSLILYDMFYHQLKGRFPTCILYLNIYRCFQTTVVEKAGKIIKRVIPILLGRQIFDFALATDKVLLCIHMFKMRWFTQKYQRDIDGLVQDCGHSRVLALELPQSCA